MPDDVKDKLARWYHRAAEGKLTARERLALEQLAEDTPDRGEQVKAQAAAIIADRFPPVAS